MTKNCECNVYNNMYFTWDIRINLRDCTTCGYTDKLQNIMGFSILSKLSKKIRKSIKSGNETKVD